MKNTFKLLSLSLLMCPLFSSAMEPENHGTQKILLSIANQSEQPIHAFITRPITVQPYEDEDNCINPAISHPVIHTENGMYTLTPENAALILTLHKGGQTINLQTIPYYDINNVILIINPDNSVSIGHCNAENAIERMNIIKQSNNNIIPQENRKAKLKTVLNNNSLEQKKHRSRESKHIRKQNNTAKNYANIEDPGKKAANIYLNAINDSKNKNNQLNPQATNQHPKTISNTNQNTNGKLDTSKKQLIIHNNNTGNTIPQIINEQPQTPKAHITRWTQGVVASANILAQDESLRKLQTTMPIWIRITFDQPVTNAFIEEFYAIFNLLANQNQRPFVGKPNEFIMQVGYTTTRVEFQNLLDQVNDMM